MSNLHFRNAIPTDAPALAANSMRSFPAPATTLAARIERYLTGPYSLASMFIAERNGEMVGQARTIEYTCWYGGVAVPAFGLGGVAVVPEARRTGVAAELVRYHLAQCVERVVPWSLLYPFSPRFYAAHGWAPSSRRLRWRFAPRALRRYAGESSARRLRWDTDDSFDALRRCYARHCVATNGSLSRQEHHLRLHLGSQTDGRFVVGVSVGAELSGYLVYELVAPTQRPQTLLVRELVALDAAAERSLLGFIAAQADQVAHALLDTPVEHPLPALLDADTPEREDDDMPYEHHPMATLYSGLMARIVDLEGALRGRGYPGRSGRVAFSLTEDPMLAANRRTVTLSVDDGAPTVTPGRASGAPLVSGAVGPLSALLTGGLGLAEAARSGLVQVDGAVSGAHALLALPVPFPLVYF